MRFQRDTRSKTKHINAPRYLEHYSVIKLAHKTSQKKRKLNPDLICNWKLHNAGDSSEEDIDDKTGNEASADNATYARLLGFPEPFPGYVSRLDESLVEQRLNRSLPVSLWTYIFRPLLKLARVQHN